MDYSSDGMMVPPSANAFGKGVYHYVRALTLASEASHIEGVAHRAQSYTEFKDRGVQRSGDHL